jgi:hypothetical protein
MTRFRVNGVLQASYRYDYLGRQVSRALTGQIPAGLTIHSVFDSAGNRIAEYNQATGALIREYVWLNGALIAVVEGGVIYYVRTDHIGRPVFATNAAGAKVWTASYLPFGGLRVSTGAPLAPSLPGPMVTVGIRLAPELDAGLRSDDGAVLAGRSAGADRWRECLWVCEGEPRELG